MRPHVLGLAAFALLAGCAPKPGFSVAATDAANGYFAPTQYYNSGGCTGGNVSPRLIWTEPPVGTKSLAVTIFDPDAREGKGWWHWLVSDLTSDSRELKAGAGTGPGALAPGAVQYRTDFDVVGYGGPCPPAGQTHSYLITVYALKTEHLSAPAGANPDQIRAALETQMIGKAQMHLKAGR